jgi:hypothetical protein
MNYFLTSITNPQAFNIDEELKKIVCFVAQQVLDRAGEAAAHVAAAVEAARAESALAEVALSQGAAVPHEFAFAESALA